MDLDVQNTIKLQNDKFNLNKEYVRTENINYIFNGKRMIAKLKNSAGLFVSYFLIVLPSIFYWIFV